MQVRPGLLLASLLCATTPLVSQSGLAIVVGLTSTNLSYEFEDGEEAEDIDSRTGFAIGVALERGSTTGLSFAPELLFVQKGANDGDLATKLSYIEVPLLFRYNFATGGSSRPYLTAGPTLALLASCTLSVDDESESCDDIYGEDESYESIDYGLMFGAGIRFNRLGVSARYEMGLGNITEESCCTEKNTALMLLGSYAF